MPRNAGQNIISEASDHRAQARDVRDKRAGKKVIPDAGQNEIKNATAHRAQARDVPEKLVATGSRRKHD